MSDESDLDVFKSLSKAPPGKTLIGEQGSSPSTGRASVPPPPPSRLSAPPPKPLSSAPANNSAPAHELALENDEPELMEADAVEELTPAPEVEPLEDADLLEDQSDFDDEEDESTQVFDSAEAGDALQLLSGPSAESPLASSVPPVGRVPPPASLAPPSRPSLPPPSATSLPPPPAPPVSASDAADWDDEDDQTTIYTRGEEQGAASALLGTAQPLPSAIPDVAPPPMSRPTAPVPTAPQQTMTSLKRATGAPPVTTGSVPPVPAANRTPLFVAAAVAAALAIGLFFLLSPGSGNLVVTVAGPGGQPLDAVEVFVDGKLKCKKSPCRLAELDAGTHMLKARAAGHQETADTAVMVTGGQEAVHNFKLLRATGTGLRISGVGDGLMLYIDGKKVGPLPQELKDMTAGEHLVKVDGEHFAAWEQRVTVEPDQMQTLGPLKLKVTKGLAQIKAGGGADGARVVLESDGDRRSLPKLPITLHIDTSKPHTLIATKKGYETFRQMLEFEDGEAERTFEIVMTRATSDDDEKRSTPRSSRRPRSSGLKSASSTPTKTSKGTATLNINSIPASKVILDGRPLGSTPRVGVSVSAGTHTVIFAHDGTRKAKRVIVSAGQTQAVVHRFK